MNEQEVLDIIAAKTENEGYYLSERKSLTGRWNGSGLEHFLINGEKPLPTFEDDWIFVKSKPERITKMVKQQPINHRFELQDKSLMSEKLPEYLNRKDVAIKLDDGWRWKEEMTQYRSLYKQISDAQPDMEVEYKFDLEVILTVSEITDPVKMAYKVPGKVPGTTEKDITEGSVLYQFADKMIFPSIVLPQRPCRLSSNQTYKIVRQYVKDHIDPKVAKVTSDYDFCFTVKRRIKLAEVKKFTVDVNNSVFQKRKRKPKYVEREQIEKEVECFEMTHSPDNYKGYTPIKGFQANSQKELKEKIDTYCEELVAFINAPLSECTGCNGMGIIILEDIND